MRYALLVVMCSMFLFSCDKPAMTQLKSGYDFGRIHAIALEKVPDYLDREGSGEVVRDALYSELQKLGLKIVSGSSDYEAIMLCSITEYSMDRKTPYTITTEDIGPGAANLSAYEAVDQGRSGNASESSHVHTPVTRTTVLHYTDSFVGIKLRLIDANTRKTEWASDFAYSSLDKKTALENCVEGALRTLKIILRK
jgi:hypothetical protein